mgnify:CR=1 FL=1
MDFKVEDKEYILEYTFEAAENQKCVDAMTDIFGGAMMTKIDESKSEALQIRDFLMTISDLPRMAMDMFYAGLLENHGEDGDGTITSRLDAKRIYKKFCKENPDDAMAESYYGLITVISEQMEKDGFFKRTGLADILEKMGKAAQETEKEAKRPTDRKRKQPTKKQKESMEKRAESHSTSE